MGPRILNLTLNPTPAPMLRQASTVMHGWGLKSNYRLKRKLAWFFNQTCCIHPDWKSEWPTSRLA